MNVLAQDKRERLAELFQASASIRKAAWEVGCNKNTAMRVRRKWIDAELQRAYDLLWDGDGEGCDAVTAPLPEACVRAMLDDWLQDSINDNEGKKPTSRWY